MDDDMTFYELDARMQILLDDIKLGAYNFHEFFWVSQKCNNLMRGEWEITSEFMEGFFWKWKDLMRVMFYGSREWKAEDFRVPDFYGERLSNMMASGRVK